MLETGDLTNTSINDIATLFCSKGFGTRLYNVPNTTIGKIGVNQFS